MTTLEAMALRVGGLVETEIGGTRVEAVVVRPYRASPTRPGGVLHVARAGLWGKGLRPDFVRYPSVIREPRQLYRRSRKLDSLPANVYADWLDEHGESRAAAKLRVAFPLDDGRAGR